MEYLCVDVAHPKDDLSRLPRWTRSKWLLAATKALGFPALMISFTGLSPGLKEVWPHLEARGAVDDDGQLAAP